MCIPAPAVMIAGQVASTAAQAIGAAGAESEQEKAYRKSADIANKQAEQSYFNLSLKQASERAATARRIQDIEVDARQAEAVAVSRAAEAGVTGASLTAYLQEFARDKGEAIAFEQRNIHLQEAEAEIQRQSIQTRTEASILAAQPAPVEQPDFIGAAFNIAGAAAKWHARENKKTTNP